MSDEEKDELSDDEYAALLRELEGRAGGAGSAPEPKGGGKAKQSAPAEPSDEVEDIDAFLRSLEEGGDDDGGPSTQTATRSEEDDALAREFAALEEKGELVAPPEKEEKKKKKEKPAKEKLSRKERREQKAREKEAAKAQKAEEKEKRAAEEGTRAKRALVFAAKNTAWFFPGVVFWWLLGSFLGQWISAGWLIALVATMFVFGTPALIKKFARRGHYKPWMAGLSLVATVALIAPMPNTAGSTVAAYGHWPASAMAEVTGASPTAAFVRANAAMTAWLGNTIATADQPGWTARQLGTVYALDMERPEPPQVAPPEQETPQESAPAEETPEPAEETPAAD